MFRSDKEVITRAQNGDPLAWTQLVKQHASRVFNLCYRFVGRSDQAEELTKETFVKVFKHLSTLHQEQRTLGPWLVSITRDLIIDQYRKTRDVRAAAPVGSNGDETIPGWEATHLTHARPGGAVGSDENSALLHRGLQQLSPDLREAVVLKDLEKFSCREIAAILNIPDGTVKSRINRGRVELAKSLRKRPIQSQNAVP